MIEIPTKKYCPCCGGVVKLDTWEIRCTSTVRNLSGQGFGLTEESEYRFHCKTCNKLFEVKEHD